MLKLESCRREWDAKNSLGFWDTNGSSLNWTMEVTKKRCAKGEGTVGYSKAIRCFNQFRSSSKNRKDQTCWGRPKTMDSKAMLQARETNPVSSTLRVSGALGISQSSVVCSQHDLSKSIRILKNFAKTFDSNITDFCTIDICHFIVSKVGDCSWGWPEGSLFDSYYTKV